MTLSSKHRGFGQSSRFALAVALAIPGAVALPAVAHAQEAAQDINVAAGDLGAALQRYSAATGVQLVYSSDLVAGKRSPGVSGRMSPQQALGQLLAGTGLSARVSGNTATLVQGSASGDVAAAEGERLLGPVRVEGSQGSGTYVAPVRGEGIAQLGGIRGGQDEEAVGYRAKVASITTGAPVAIEDIPRSITVQTQEQIEKQDINTIGEALERLPGIALVEDASGAATVFSRGFQITQIQVDGGAPRSLDVSGNGSTLNLDAYERVELVRGPNALFTGEGSVGGSINLVRKRPSSEPYQSFTLGAGSYSNVNIGADLSTPGLFGLPAAFRGVVSLRREGEQYDHYSSQNAMLYGILDIPLGDNARLEAGARYSHFEYDGAYVGLPRYVEGDLIDLSRDFNPFSRRPKGVRSETELFSKLYVDIAEDWDFEIGLSSQTRRAGGGVASANLSFTRNGVALNPRGGISITDNASLSSLQILVDSKLTGRFSTFGFQHSPFIGVSYSETVPAPSQRTKPNGAFSNARLRTISDFLNPQYQNIAARTVPELVYYEDYINQVGVVIGDTVSWRDIVIGSITFRRDVVYSKSASVSLDGASVDLSDPVGTRYTPTWQPSYSISIKPTKNLTAFASYSTGFNRNDDFFTTVGEGSDIQFSLLGPTIFRNMEAGAKVAANGLLVSLSYYRIKNKNSPVPNFEQQICPPSVSGGGFNSTCYFAGIDQESSGFDMELSGKIFRNLAIISNFNYNKSKYIGQFSEVPGSLENRAPVSSGNIFFEWNPDFAKALSLRFGARYRGRVYESGERQFYDEDNNPICANPDCVPEPYEFEEKPYVALDAGIDYAIKNGPVLRLNVENLANARYLSTVSRSTSGGNFYGRPRSFMATLTWREARSVLGNNRSSSSVLFGKARNWYAAFDLGWQPKAVLTASASGKASDGVTPVVWDHDLGGGAAGFGRIGYYVAPRLRAELELQYRPSALNDIGGSDVAPFGACGIRQSGGSGQPFQCDDVGGKVNSYGAFANILFDVVDRDARFVPFVGGGVGITRDAISYQGKLEGIGGSDPWLLDFGPGAVFTDAARQSRESIAVSDVSKSFAWQLIGGFSYKAGERLNIDASWRYINSENVKWNSYNFGEGTSFYGPPLTPTIGQFRADRRSHVVSIGVRWAFGN